ncbi:MAG: peptidoglycan bridge formation glycyltransferase FemA/FemB family protein [Flavobacteriales bacterium]|nr:peptidoglycan bridge formation glycyltransferase FemA/FemB family protein [Flavobacteriales bacterium]
MISYKYANSLSKEEESDVITFFNTVNHISISQHPLWAKCIERNKELGYFLFYINRKLVGYCICTEKLRFANIHMGPIVSKNELLVELIEIIYKHYRKLNFGLLNIQLGMLDTEEVKAYTDSVRKKINYSTSNGILNWSSVRINILSNQEDIVKSFSTNHKRSIKKAIGNGLTTRKLMEMEDVVQFSELYESLYAHRKLISPLADSTAQFHELYQLLKNENRGFILGVLNENELLIGGVCIVYQGNTAFYSYGASLPEYRKLPILHLAFHEVIGLAKKDGMDFLDLGGYSNRAADDDQLKGINRFKDGFNGEKLNYPKVLIFKPKKMLGYLLSALRKLNSSWNRRR